MDDELGFRIKTNQNVFERFFSKLKKAVCSINNIIMTLNQQWHLPYHLLRVDHVDTLQESLLMLCIQDYPSFYGVPMIVTLQNWKYNVKKNDHVWNVSSQLATKTCSPVIEHMVFDSNLDIFGDRFSYSKRISINLKTLKKHTSLISENYCLTRKVSSEENYYSTKTSATLNFWARLWNSRLIGDVIYFIRTA